MHIQELSIQKFGVINNQEMKDIPSGLTIIHGKNEAGKSTLVHCLRCMICGLPKGITRSNQEYKNIPMIDHGFSGSMKVLAPNVYNSTILLQRTYNTGSKKESILSLYGENDIPLENELWNKILGSSIDLEVYRNIFGISLSELIGLPTGAKIKDMLYGASLGAGTRPPSAILKEIEEKANKIFMKRGQNASVNKLLEELAQVEKEKDACLSSMKEYTLLQKKLAELVAESTGIEDIIKTTKKAISLIQKQHKAWSLWKTTSILKEELQNTTKDYSGFTSSMREQFLIFETGIKETQSHLTTLDTEIDTLQKDLDTIKIHMPLLEHEQEIRNLEEIRVQYDRDQEEVEEVNETILFIQKDIEEKLQELGADWTQERSNQFVINLATEQEIDIMRKKLQAHDAKIYHNKQTLEDAYHSLETVQQNCLEYKNKEQYFYEIPLLIETSTIYKNSIQKIEQLREKIEDKKQNIYRVLNSHYPEWKEEEALECTPSPQNILMLRSQIEQYTQELAEKTQQENKAKTLEIQIETLADSIHDIIDTQETSHINNPEKELKTVKKIEELIYAKYALQNNGGSKTYTILSTLVFFLLISFTSLLSFSSSTLLGQSLLFAIGSIASIGITAFIFFYYKKQATHSTQKQLEKLNLPGITSIEDIEYAITAAKHFLVLEDLSKQTLEEVKESINQYIYREEQKKEKQKAYTKITAQLTTVNEKIEQQRKNIDQICIGWTMQLKKLSMPHIGLYSIELNHFLGIIKEIQRLKQEEYILEAEIRAEQQIQFDMHTRCQQSLACRYLEQSHPNSLYTPQIFTKALEQYITPLQEEFKRYEDLQKDYSRIEKKIAILEQILLSHNENPNITTELQEWKAWLEEYGYPDFLTPDTIINFIDHIKYIQKKNTEILTYRAKQETLHKRITAFKEKIIVLQNILPLPIVQNLPTEPLHILQTISASAKEENTKAQKKQTLENMLQQTTKEYKKLYNQLTNKKEERTLLLEKTNTKTTEEFQESYDAYLKRDKKKEELTNYIHSLQELIHPSKIEDLSLQLQNTSEEDLEEQQAEKTKEVEELERTRNAILEQVGSIKEKIQQAEKGDITTHSLKHAMLTSQIEEYMNTWYTLRTTVAIIKQAQKQFENERQPRVMQIASDFMSTITQNTWNRILRSTEDTIKIRNISGREAIPEHLSRGAQEQMYFALRLAGASIHAMSTQEALPILLDDITVNFDPERALGVAKVLQKLTQGGYEGIPKHQIFFFTCHDTIAENLCQIIPEAKLFSMENSKIYPY